MKKIIVLFILFVIFSIGNSEILNWSQISYQAFLTGSSDDIDVVTSASPNAGNAVNTKLKSGLRWQHEFKGNFDHFNISLKNDFFYSEKRHESRNSFLFNDAKLKLSYFPNSYYFKLQYGNRWFDEDNTRILTIPGTEEITKQKMVHNTELQYKSNWEKLKFSFYGKLRNLDFDYFVFDEENSNDEFTGFSEWENDIYTSAKISYEINNLFNLFVSGYYKDDLNEYDLFNHTKFGVGLNYFKKYDFFNFLNANFTYFHNDSERISDEKTHYFLTKMRYTKRIGTSLAGFVSYINRSCYDSEQNKLLRISNMLRIQAKYSYRLDTFMDSYVLAGIKINPENKGSLIFSELNQYIYKNFFGLLSIKYADELFYAFSSGFEYYLSPVKSFWIKNEFTDFNKSPTHNIIFIGSTVLF